MEYWRKVLRSYQEPEPPTAIDLFHITVMREHEFTLEDCIELGGWDA